MVVVPDASVILKWVLQREGEADSHQALALLDACLTSRVDARLPTLWRYEVGNILGLKQPDLAGEAMETLLAYRFAEATLDRDYCLDVLHFMRGAKGISFYDAAYHVLAIREKGVFVTADRAYAKTIGRRRDLALLVDWMPPRQRA